MYENRFLNIDGVGKIVPKWEIYGFPDEITWTKHLSNLRAWQRNHPFPYRQPSEVDAHITEAKLVWDTSKTSLLGPTQIS